MVDGAQDCLNYDKQRYQFKTDSLWFQRRIKLLTVFDSKKHQRQTEKTNINVKATQHDAEHGVSSVGVKQPKYNV